MTNKQLLKKYDKITDDICTLGKTRGVYYDTDYYNQQGALQDWYELEDALAQGITDDSCVKIMNRLDKALIVAKTIDKIDKLESILKENIQYG